MNVSTLIDKFYSLLYLLLHHWRYKMMFGTINRKCRIFSPLRIDGAKNIFIKGKYTIIGRQTWLAAKTYNGNSSCKLEIGAGSKIGNFNHIYCTQRIIIEKNVLTADKVYISDNLHCYENIEIPIFMQPIKQLKTVVIGEGAWLGENVCVIGASVGRGSVVGANSVVTKDIPDYCVAVGIPAKVIKQYNHITKQWERKY